MTTANGRVLVVAAHPDDPEFLAGGTIARLAKEDRKIAYVIVTNGNKGSSDRSVASEQLIPIREAEQRHAARVLGVARTASPSRSYCRTTSLTRCVRCTRSSGSDRAWSSTSRTPWI